MSTHLRSPSHSRALGAPSPPPSPSSIPPRSSDNELRSELNRSLASWSPYDDLSSVLDRSLMVAAQARRGPLPTLLQADAQAPARARGVLQQKRSASDVRPPPGLDPASPSNMPLSSGLLAATAEPPAPEADAWSAIDAALSRESAATRAGEDGAEEPPRLSQASARDASGTCKQRREKKTPGFKASVRQRMRDDEDLWKQFYLGSFAAPDESPAPGLDLPWQRAAAPPLCLDAVLAAPPTAQAGAGSSTDATLSGDSKVSGGWPLPSPSAMLPPPGLDASPAAPPAPEAGARSSKDATSPTDSKAAGSEQPPPSRRALPPPPNFAAPAAPPTPRAGAGSSADAALSSDLAAAKGGEDEVPLPPTFPQVLAEHAAGTCKPCGWFWKPGGCHNGSECRRCHLCPPGAKRQRHQEKKATAFKQSARQRARDDEELWKKFHLQGTLAAGGTVSTAQPAYSAYVIAGAVGPSNMRKVMSPPTALPGQMSLGSAKHARGACTPCAMFWRPGGCPKGSQCMHCHLCPAKEPERVSQKVAAVSQPLVSQKATAASQLPSLSSVVEEDEEEASVA